MKKKQIGTVYLHMGRDGNCHQITVNSATLDAEAIIEAVRAQLFNCGINTYPDMWKRRYTIYGKIIDRVDFYTRIRTKKIQHFIAKFKVHGMKVTVGPWMVK